MSASRHLIHLGLVLSYRLYWIKFYMYVGSDVNTLTELRVLMSSLSVLGSDMKANINFSRYSYE
jgi:hypothetical protein